jgi:hypothetical protein
MSTTKTYIGTKVIHALPMTRQAYNDYRGWQLPDNEDGADDGYLVEYVDGGRATIRATRATSAGARRTCSSAPIVRSRA